MTYPKRVVGQSGRESVMAVDRFCRNAVGPPEWEFEAMGSVVWVQCANLCRECVLNLSIAASSIMGIVHTRSHRLTNTHMTELLIEDLHVYDVISNSLAGCR